jgi:hypothetical protein
MVSYKKNSSQNGKNICRKKAQETQERIGFFVLFAPLCG